VCVCDTQTNEVKKKGDEKNDGWHDNPRRASRFLRPIIGMKEIRYFDQSVFSFAKQTSLSLSLSLSVSQCLCDVSVFDVGAY